MVYSLKNIMLAPPRRIAQSARHFFDTFSGRFLPIIWLVAALLPPIYALSEYIGLLQYTETQTDTERLYNLSKIKESLESQLKENPDASPLSHIEPAYASSLFAQRTVIVTAYWRKDQPPTYKYRNDYRISFDTLIVFVGLWLVVLYALRALGSKPSAQNATERVTQAEAGAEANTALPPTSSSESSLERTSRTTVLLREVEFARSRADQIYSRSTIMLVAGVVMAFVGISVFYISIPRASTELKIDVFLIESIRPTAMLFFLEALAWFLLKQYRTLADEYRQFHQLAQRRADFLIAFLSLGEQPDQEASTFVLSSLLKDVPSVVLKTGETTEALEAAKASQSNPVFDLATLLAERIPLPNAKKDA